MCKFIGIEDLVANALIELIENNDSRVVSFDQLNKYGAVIVKILRENNEEAILLVNKHYTTDLIRNYTDFFEIIDLDSENPSIVLKNNKSVDDLRNTFRAFMSIDMLLAFTNKESLLELGVAA